MRSAAPIHVVAAALVRDDGCVLIMQRLPGTHMAGRWEFPGGKIEADEAISDALSRELHEELGVTPRAARPLIRIRHEYPDRSVLLDCWRVDAWDGEVAAREGHQLVWEQPDALPRHDILEADWPMVTALRLPERYAITADLPPAALLGAVAHLVDSGHTLVQLRAPSLDATTFRSVATEATEYCRVRGVGLLLNTAPELAAALNADGVHLAAARVRASRSRPLAPDRWVAASCHDAVEMDRARRLGCDFAVLGPVNPTRSHRHGEPMGWQTFGRLADCAGMPVYALGGMGGDDTERARTHHGQGIAAISAFSGR